MNDIRMSHNRGFVFEHNFIDALDGEIFEDLPNNLRHLIRFMFPKVKKKRVKCEKYDPRAKADVAITLGGEKKLLSLKTGNAVAIHAEDIKKFILFLRAEGISVETQKTILLFQYGDGSLNGNGGKRLPYEKILPMLSERIQRANEELNEDKDLLFKFMDRVFFKGNYKELEPWDYIYHGNLDYGVICSKEQIKKHLKRREYAFIRNLHIGPVHFGPKVRYLSGEGMHPEDRNIVNFKWVGLEADLAYIQDRYDG